MLTRTVAGILGGGALALATAGEAGAQVAGHVVLDGGSIAVSVVFDQRPEAVGERDRVRRGRSLPPRYRRGLGLLELERYLVHVEMEYEHYRRLHPADAYVRLGWTEHQLRSHVRWLRDERRWLRDERRRLERAAGLRRGMHRGRGR